MSSKWKSVAKEESITHVNLLNTEDKEKEHIGVGAEVFKAWELEVRNILREIGKLGSWVVLGGGG